jgi:hypothetical protein
MVSDHELSPPAQAGKGRWKIGRTSEGSDVEAGLNCPADPNRVGVEADDRRARVPTGRQPRAVGGSDVHDQPTRSDAGDPDELGHAGSRVGSHRW